MELGIFMREHFNGMYRTDTYYITRQMAEMPIQILSPILFTSIFYWMVGMNPDISRFLIACLINILLVQVRIKWLWYICLLAIKIIQQQHILIRIDHIFDWPGSRWFWIHGILSCTVSANCTRDIRAAAHPVDDIWRVLSKQQVKFICKTVYVISISFLVHFFFILIS